ncbi:MAG: chemotaxis protein CheB, partial [Actinobacteria bacterium]
THLVVDRTSGVPRMILTDAPPMHGVRPAADLLLESVAAEFKDRAVGVVLTGMGSDGAQGALAIKRAGGDTIAQDEATSVVWGMPGAAVKVNAVGRSVPLGLVAAEIRRAVRARSTGRGA